MQVKPLSVELRALRDAFRYYVGSHQRPTIDACRELTGKLTVLAERADALECDAAMAVELEAVARDLDVAACAAASPALQAALKVQQAELQRELDGGGPVHVSRPGLAALSTPIGDSNIVTFPRAPRPALFDDGGDAA